jgi:hypothetical protein
MKNPIIKSKKTSIDKEVKPIIKEIDINTYTKEKLDIDTTKIEKTIVKLKKLILNHDEELKLKEKELIELQLELTQLKNLKNYVA